MNRRSLVTLVLAAAVAVWVVSRQRAIRRAELDQVRLQTAAAEAAKLRAALAEARPATPVIVDPPLTSAERAELLRLRGEVNRLRRDLAQSTNRVARATRTPSPQPAQPAAPQEETGAVVVTREQALAKMNSGKQWMLALMLHAADNGDKLPATLAEAAKYANGAAGMDDFEMLLSGDLHAIELPAMAIVLREKEPWKGPRGRWNRTYAFADGHTEIASSDTEDFTAWEERKKNPPPPAPGQ